MAVTCPDLMYGAYYPYLYGRGARSFHHAPHFQYDRFNVQTGNGGEGYGAAAGVSSGSASSGAQSPGSPPHAAHLRAKEELSAPGRASADGGGSSESEGECAAHGRARAQYVSANCVVFTHYSGDVAAVVDEHFARALAADKPKESVPMVSRNLPASFFNAAAGAACGVDLYDYDPWHQHYSGYVSLVVPMVSRNLPTSFNAAAGPACVVDLYDYDPWHQHYSGYGHAAHRHAAEYHAAAAAQAAQAHNMAAAGYPPLLLGRSPLHAQYKPVEWQHSLEHHAPHAPHAAHAACSPYSYPAVPGLEAQVQDTSKDLYWF
ncbi:protein vestigial isoform X2 [Cydia pomonella]|uniref:protein vestigial isoform X2 n=1 Tax=Cydia pomonella TaxID=82600 RepID=UPI002ADDB5DE|nr:protein vestigial isoform X2 [Cydia pomonella]